MWSGQTAWRRVPAIRVTYPDQTVLAVGHGIINKVVQSIYYDKPINEIPRMANAEVRVLML